MNRFKKMILIPKMEYERLKALRAEVNPLQKILSNPEYNTDELKRIHGAHFLNQQLVSEPDEIKSETQTKIDKYEWAKTLPKSQQLKGEQLIKRLHEEIDWNQRGEVTLKSGQRVTTANIQDLLHFLVRDRKGVSPPFGFHQILPAIRKLNLPRELVSNPKAFRLIYNRELSNPFALHDQMVAVSPPRKRIREESPYFEWPGENEN